jgi:hypothetical protein
MYIYRISLQLPVPSCYTRQTSFELYLALRKKSTDGWNDPPIPSGLLRPALTSVSSDSYQYQQLHEQNPYNIGGRFV